MVVRSMYRIIAAGVLVVGTVSCGDQEQIEPSRQSSGGDQLPERDYLIKVTEGTVDPLTVPLADGGAVIVVGHERTGGGVIATRSGVRLNSDGEVVDNLSLSTPLAEPVATAIGRSLFLAGIPCVGEFQYDDVGQFICEPGGYRLFEYDLTTGKERALDLPEPGLADMSMVGRYVSLNSSYGRLVMGYANSNGSPGIQYAQRVVDGWTPIEQTSGSLCQSGDRLIASSGEAAMLPFDTKGSEELATQLSVLDVDGRWADIRNSPKILTGAGTGLKVNCTKSHVVIIPWGPPESPTRGAVLDISSGVWTEVSLAPGFGALQPFSWPTVDSVIATPLPYGSNLLEFDPDRGTTRELAGLSQKVSVMVPVSESVLLRLGLDGGLNRDLIEIGGN
jgi:hypothetical protein